VKFLIVWRGSVLNEAEGTLAREMLAVRTGYSGFVR
jgi:hypothetical protein